MLERAVAAGRGSPEPTGRAKGRSRSCDICTAEGDVLFKVFAKWQYMLATDEAARRAFADVRGFGQVHTWQFQQVASPLGLSEGYAPLIDAVGAELRRAVRESSQDAVARVRTLLTTEETCPACRTLREMEREQVRRLLDQWGSACGERPGLEGPGLCLPHLHAALAVTRSPEITSLLLREEVGRLEELSEDLRNHALKRNALRRGLLNSNEEAAWWRALVILVGARAGVHGHSMSEDRGSSGARDRSVTA
jgi:hypothetical protein